MKLSLKSAIVPNIPQTVLLVIICIGLWFLAYLGTQFAPQPTQNTVVDNILSTLPLGSLLLNAISLVLTFINALLLAQINNRFTIIRSRTFLPTLTFFILMSSMSETHLKVGYQLVLTINILALFNFFRMAKDRQASEQAFMGSFLLSLSSIILNPLLFIIPVCWIGFMMFQSFSLRTFLASIFGAATPWILYLSGLFMFQGKVDFLSIINLQLPPAINPASILLPQAIYFGTLLVIFVICVIEMLSLSNSDAIHTRNKLNFLSLLITALIAIAVIYHNQFIALIPLIIFIYALLISHPLTLKQNNFNGIIFIIFCVINLAYIISKFIQL